MCVIQQLLSDDMIIHFNILRETEVLIVNESVWIQLYELKTILYRDIYEVILVSVLISMLMKCIE